MEWKPSSDPKKRLGFFLLIPWVETNVEERPKMLEGIIPKEYLVDHTDYTDVVVISQ